MKLLVRRAVLLASALCVIAPLVLFPACSDDSATPANQTPGLPSYEGKKILFVHSYHQEFEWVEGIDNGVNSVLDNTSVELKTIYMDTKRNPEEGFKEQAALDAKSMIEEFDPDVVITADDNAFKYLVMPYYRDAEIPFVFCGVNWDISVYDGPCNNTTGMVEVGLVPQLIDYLAAYTNGDKIGFLGYESISARKDATAYKDVFGIELAELYITTFDEWKTAFLELQDEVDMLILHTPTYIEGWGVEQAQEFVVANTTLPTGTINEPMMPYALLGVTKVAREQGEWAARAALQILDGTDPSDIPVAQNKQGKLMLNLDIAEKLDIAFDPIMLKNAKIYERGNP